MPHEGLKQRKIRSALHSERQTSSKQSKQRIFQTDSIQALTNQLSSFVWSDLHLALAHA